MPTDKGRQHSSDSAAVRLRGIDGYGNDLVGAQSRGMLQHGGRVGAQRDDGDIAVNPRVTQTEGRLDGLLVVGVHQPRDGGLGQRLPVLADD